MTTAFFLCSSDLWRQTMTGFIGTSLVSDHRHRSSIGTMWQPAEQNWLLPDREAAGGQGSGEEDVKAVAVDVVKDDRREDLIHSSYAPLPPPQEYAAAAEGVHEQQQGDSYWSDGDSYHLQQFDATQQQHLPPLSYNNNNLQLVELQQQPHHHQNQHYFDSTASGHAANEFYYGSSTGHQLHQYPEHDSLGVGGGGKYHNDRHHHGNESVILRVQTYTDCKVELPRQVAPSRYLPLAAAAAFGAVNTATGAPKLDTNGGGAWTNGNFILGCLF